MQIDALSLDRVRIPFAVRFAHAAASRACTESVWVRVRAAQGPTGHGEGCPRRYVTGEDLASAGAFFSRHRSAIQREIADVASLCAWTAGHRLEIDAAPAAWCALELALLDWIGRCRGESLESLLRLPPLEGAFHYSAVIGTGDLGTTARVLSRYRACGMRQYKLKLSGDLALDRARAALLIGSGISGERLRLDANGLWTDPLEAAEYLGGLGADYWAIEEPLRAGDLAGLDALSRRCGRPVILDESLLRAETLAMLPGPPERWIANLRVSKLGGLERSLRVLQAARARGVRVIVGAQVGETSVLTRAALTLASCARSCGLLLAQEGAFGTALLARDVCDRPLEFGRAGRLRIDRAHLREGHGTGLQIRPAPDWLVPLDA